MATEKSTANAAVKKPATTRKPAAKRGPTKAAALKALGITQEHLDILKDVEAARSSAQASEKVPTKVGPPVQPYATVSLDALSVEERAKVLELRKANTEKSLARPYVTDTPVDPLVFEAERALLPDPPAHSAHIEKPTEQTFFARNLRNVEANIRLSRQKSGEKRLSFKPRGQRGDLAKLQKEDLEDEQLLANVGLIIEIITAAEAKAIIERQVVNHQQAIHPSLALLRNELGEEYQEGAFKTEIPYEQQGVVVAHLQPQGGEAGNIPSSGRGVDWNTARNPQPQPAPGGNPGIISDGFADAKNRNAAAADAIARRKDLEGPAAGLGGARVVIEQPRES